MCFQGVCGHSMNADMPTWLGIDMLEPHAWEIQSTEPSRFTACTGWVWIWERNARKISAQFRAITVECCKRHNCQSLCSLSTSPNSPPCSGNHPRIATSKQHIRNCKALPALLHGVIPENLGRLMRELTDCKQACMKALKNRVLLQKRNQLYSGCPILSGSHNLALMIVKVERTCVNQQTVPQVHLEINREWTDHWL